MPIQIVRRVLAQAAINVAEMGAEQIVEFVVVARILVSAEPPELVTPLGHVQRSEPRVSYL